MEWKEFFEGFFLKQPSDIVEKIPFLENVGPSGDIIMEIGYLSLEGSKEDATVLLEKALQMNVTFTADEMGQISCNCTEEGCKKAFYKSAKTYSPKDLEELKYIIDDEWAIDVASKYNIRLTGVLADINAQVDELLINSQTVAPQRKRPKKRRGFSDEEILALGLYPDDELYKMSLISRILNKR